MRICIPTFKKDPESVIFSQFGQAEYFLIFSDEGRFEQAISNEGKNIKEGVELQAAQTLINANIRVLLVRKIGSEALSNLRKEGIKIFRTPPEKSAKEAFLMWSKGRLKKIKQEE